MSYYNENGEFVERDLETVKYAVKCSHCGRAYDQVREEQIPGFRDKSYDICPYCNEVNGSSMEWEFCNSKID